VRWKKIGNAEMEEEWRNKVKSLEGRIRILEDRMEEVLKEIKEIREEIKRDEGRGEREESMVSNSGRSRQIEDVDHVGNKRG